MTINWHFTLRTIPCEICCVFSLLYLLCLGLPFITAKYWRGYLIIITITITMWQLNVHWALLGNTLMCMLRPGFWKSLAQNLHLRWEWVVLTCFCLVWLTEPALVNWPTYICTAGSSHLSLVGMYWLDASACPLLFSSSAHPYVLSWKLPADPSVFLQLHVPLVVPTCHPMDHS